MYSRSERFKTSSKISPIGPATYVLCEKRNLKQCTFGSAVTSAQQLTDLSPASYYPECRKYRIVGGSSLRNTEKKIFLPPAKGPCPNVHDMSDLFGPRYQYKPNVYQELYRGTPYKFDKMDPTFPTHSKIFTLTKDGSMVQQPPLIKRTFSERKLLAPFPGEMFKPTLKYKGQFWSKMKSVRLLHNVGDNPSPTEYDPYRKIVNPRELWDEAVRAQKRHESRVRRDLGSSAIVDKDVPGPSHYRVNFDPIHKPKSFNKNGTFSKGKRETVTGNDNPPPWKYDVQKKIRCTGSIKRVPFLTKARQLSKIEITPGPADYGPDMTSIKYTISTKMPSKYFSNYERIIPFGSSTKRFKRDYDCDAPGPAQCNMNDLPKRVTYVDAANPPKSKYPRILENECNDIPSPAYYESDEAYKKMINPKSHLKKPIPFGTLGPQRGTLKMDCLPAGANYSPDYNATRPRVIGGLILERRNENPEPDWRSYDIHPKYSTSFYLETHNYSIMERRTKVYPNFGSSTKALRCFFPHYHQ